MKYLILGAGPAGLTLANRLKQLGEDDFLVLEHEKQAGGLCRSIEIDEAPLDIGGGHFLDVRRPNVNRFLFGFMPESEWNIFERDSRIVINNDVISHPIEANIWQMNTDAQVEFLKSIASAGSNIGEKMPVKFVDWIYWKLGSKIAEEYMIPYNQKIFSQDLNELGTYWLDKLPNVSFEETLRSCLERKPYGTQPGHAQFYYPKKYGYGELWLRMANSIEGKIKYEETVQGINFDKRVVYTKCGAEYQADVIITTIPWMEFQNIVGMPSDIKELINRLKYSSVQVEYFPKHIDTDAHWIYYPNKKLSYHRILVRHNFCPNSRGYWTETNSNLVKKDEKDSYRYMNRYAYPLNTLDKPEIMKILLDWCEKKSVIGLGRWGEHQHYNSDLTVDLALRLAEKLVER